MVGPQHLTRRTLLHFGILAAVTGTAGCTFGGTNEEIPVTLANNSNTTHELAITISFEESTLLDQSETLEPGDSIETTIQNPETAGSAQVTATLPNHNPATNDIRVGPGTGIRTINIEITADNSVSIFAGRT
jgi:hypothetical protein